MSDGDQTAAARSRWQVFDLRPVATDAWTTVFDKTDVLTAARCSRSAVAVTAASCTARSSAAPSHSAWCAVASAPGISAPSTGAWTTATAIAPTAPDGARNQAW